MKKFKKCWIGLIQKIEQIEIELVQRSARILKFYRTWNCSFEFTYLRIGKYDECDYEYFATKLPYSYIFEKNNSDIILYYIRIKVWKLP